MSKSISPEEVVINPSDVVEQKAEEQTAPAEVPSEEVQSGEAAAVIPDYSSKSLPELVEALQVLGACADRLQRSKEAEAIKSGFYKLLSKLKAEAQSAAQAAGAEIEAAAAAANSKFSDVEEKFKALYADYKRERAEFNRRMEEERVSNLKIKRAVIDELRALIDAQEDVNTTFPRFREIQAKWRATGPVPAADFRDINQSYQFLVEKFYDVVKINHDLRDLDFKKNLEAKEAFCAAAEKLAENDNVVAAFHELQKLHEQWKDFGPVAQEYRDAIWERFKAATAVINKKYQEYFENQKETQKSNLEAKTSLCERLEQIVAGEFASSADWNAATKQIEALQQEWRGIGFATRRDNQKIYDRFRASCDAFFERKRVFYNEFKEGLNENFEKKAAIVREAEELKSSTDWKKTADRLIALQKEWKQIGSVPRKKSEQLWKQFRAACDEFFEARQRNAGPENDYYSNLKAKQKIIADIRGFVAAGAADLQKAADEFEARWNAIGFVPMREKERITREFRDLMKEKFPDRRRTGAASRAQSPKAAMINKYKALQQDIVTYENNIGFFASSRRSAPLIAQMQQRIDDAQKAPKAPQDQLMEFEKGEEQ
ncbi:MAG: DUF349 domain-containing protein [Bacteroidales bacterium]|nr:DUF349 domain-containing protein [Bacteroidales bacterium]